MMELPHSGVIKVVGKDACTVVNNLCTNNLKALPIGQCLEAFVTEVHGWCVAHAIIAKFADEIWLIGQFVDTERVCAHIDRYIIREEAVVTNLSKSYAVWHVSCRKNLSQSLSKLTSVEPSLTSQSALLVDSAGSKLVVLACSILSENEALMVAESNEQSSSLLAQVAESNMTAELFECRRIANRWPLAGKEILEKTIPQELDRNAMAISFTKGCYLGQETIARLDARGQLQKKICLVHIDTQEPITSGTALVDDAKEVGHVTSAAWCSVIERTVALAYMRRGYFDPGRELMCNGAKAVVS